MVRLSADRRKRQKRNGNVICQYNTDWTENNHRDRDFIMLLEEIKAHSQDANARLDRLYTFLKIDDYKKTD